MCLRIVNNSVMKIIYVEEIYKNKIKRTYKLNKLLNQQSTLVVSKLNNNFLMIKINDYSLNYVKILKIKFVSYHWLTDKISNSN